MQTRPPSFDSRNSSLSLTASHGIKDGKVFMERGAPEGVLDFYGKNLGVASAKALHEAIRNRAKEAELPQLILMDFTPSRTTVR
ncbi:hypothetical protein Q1695_003016 [Nippostrongylus brasiliensis]|nr:hypothetical protein Q1695_003016 [Nippostrongylus brasiliensis]